MRDMFNAISAKVAIAPQVIADNTAPTPEIVDRKGYEALTFVIETGTLVDANATFAVTVRHGDDSGLSDGAAVATTDLVGTLALAGFTFAADGACRKLGYLGNKRYVEITVTPTGNDETVPGDPPEGPAVPVAYAPIACIAVLGAPLNTPTPNPPV